MEIVEHIRQRRSGSTREVQLLLEWIRGQNIWRDHDQVIESLEREFGERDDLGQEVGRTKTHVLQQKIGPAKGETRPKNQRLGRRVYATKGSKPKPRRRAFLHTEN